MRLIELTMVYGEQRGSTTPSLYDEDEDGNVVQLPASEAAVQPTELTEPVAVNVEQIRNFYPRKPDHRGNPRQGTRITLIGGSGMAVQEEYSAVLRMVNGH